MIAARANRESGDDSRMPGSLKIVVSAVLIFLSVFLVLALIRSLTWQCQLDTPIMFYIAFLMDRFGSVPYRDIFDFNMPGTHLAYYLIGKLTGFTEFGFRCSDVIIFLGISSITWFWMKDLGYLVAWCGCILWGLIYLGYGPAMSLQREYLALLPILAGAFVYSSNLGGKASSSVMLAGVMFGFAATIKPQAAIGLLVVLLFDSARVLRESVDGRFFRVLRSTLLPAMAGLLLPLAGIFLYLWISGSLSSFMQIATKYWPLYAHLNGEHEAISGYSRLHYLLKNYLQLGNFSIWLAPATVGGYLALYQSTLSDVSKRQVRLLITLACAYSIYPVIAGQFWPYHWLPFMFFILQAASLCLVRQPQDGPEGRHWYPIVLLVFVLIQTFPVALLRESLHGAHRNPQYTERVNQIATYLGANLNAEDTVQPLDWTGGAVHAMLIAKARLATPFVYDFCFYHDTSDPYIQQLRDIFIADLRRSTPRFVIQISGEDKPWVTGPGTTREFPQLQELLSNDYGVVSAGEGYQIYRLKDSGKLEGFFRTSHLNRTISTAH